MHLADLSPGEEIQWVIPGLTESIYCQRMVSGAALHITGFLRVKDSLGRYVYFSISY